MKKVVSFLIMIVLLIGIFSFGVMIGNNSTEKRCLNNNNSLYQGPVPLGYDEELFRETGETIEEVSK